MCLVLFSILGDEIRANRSRERLVWGNSHVPSFSNRKNPCSPLKNDTFPMKFDCVGSTVYIK